MKKRKWIFIGLALACVILEGIVLAVTFIPKKNVQPQMKLYEAKMYHINNRGTYYTREYENGELAIFNTKATLSEVFSSLTSNDVIILDEDITLTSEINVRSFALVNARPVAVDVDINFDLNGHKISTDVNTVSNDALFTLLANYGKISFNIRNGELYSNDLSYLFRMKTSAHIEDGINLKINNVDCTVEGDATTPLFAHNEGNDIKVEANNSKFISKKSDQASNYGVGAFINSDSTFDFNNCYFEGGDAIYVKNGTVNLTNCELQNKGLAKRNDADIVALETFEAIGTCLATESYTTANGVTEFDITITNCIMKGENSSTMMYVAATADAGKIPGVNSESSINVVSCTFNNNPTTTIPEYEIIKYPNGQTPQLTGEQIWTVGY